MVSNRIGDSMKEDVQLTSKQELWLLPWLTTVQWIWYLGKVRFAFLDVSWGFSDKSYLKVKKKSKKNMYAIIEDLGHKAK